MGAQTRSLWNQHKQFLPWRWIPLFFSEGGGWTADLSVLGGGSSTLPENFPGEADEQRQKGEWSIVGQKSGWSIVGQKGGWSMVGQKGGWSMMGKKGECGWLGQQRAIFFMLMSAWPNFHDWHWNLHWVVTSHTPPKLWCHNHCSAIVSLSETFHAYPPQRDVPLYLYLLPVNLSEDLYQMNSIVQVIVSGGAGLHVEEAIVPHRGSTGSDGTHALQLPGRCSTHKVILRVNCMVAIQLTG